jgi:hypothetical protein
VSKALDILLYLWERDSLTDQDYIEFSQSARKQMMNPQEIVVEVLKMLLPAQSLWKR